MRADVARLLALASPLAALGCIESQPKFFDDPSAVAREEAREETVSTNRIAPPSRATSRTVRCGCDADGDLHVSVPAGSKVTRPEDAVHPAEAQIVLPDEAPPRPIRKTVSLGFIGDGKLTQLPSRGHWDVQDNVLPPHRHGHGGRGYYGYAPPYRQGGYPPYGPVPYGPVAPYPVAPYPVAGAPYPGTVPGYPPFAQ